MLNQFIGVGRITKVGENYFIISIPRTEKNGEGVYENDELKISAQGKVMENIKAYCHQGDIIGVKGRIGEDNHKITIKAEKVSFLSTKPSK